MEGEKRGTMDLAPQKAEHLLRDVNTQHSFKLHLGTEIRNLSELAELLDVMSDASFAHHVSAKKNDFANWVREVVHDDELARMLTPIHDRQEMARVVNAHVTELEHTSSRDPVDAKTFMHTGVRDFAIGAVIGIVVGIGIAMFL